MKAITALKAACLSLALLANTLSHALPVKYEDLRSGDLVDGPIRAGSRTIVLPDGTWSLIGKSEKNTREMRDGVTVVTMHFQEVLNGRVNRMLRVIATTTSKTASWNDNPCQSKGDSFWIEDKKRSLNDQFCIRVGFEAGVVDGARGADFVKWAQDIKAKGIGYSPEMPFVLVTRFTSYDFLSIGMSFDPSVSGIGRSENAPRQFNDWNPAIAASKPRQTRFYDSLVSWAPTFAAAVERNFAGDVGQRSDFGKPALPGAVLE